MVVSHLLLTSHAPRVFSTGLPEDGMYASDSDSEEEDEDDEDSNGLFMLSLLRSAAADLEA